MIILGVDPGLNITGYGVIESDSPSKIKLKEAGVIRTNPKDGIAKRLDKIYKNLLDVAQEYKPDVLVLEKLYSHYKHPVTSLLMGHARGVICLVAGVCDVELISYPSTRIKKVITGKGHASKEQVQGMVQGLLKLKKKPEPVDVSDAIACAIAYVNLESKNINDIKNKR